MLLRTSGRLFIYLRSYTTHCRSGLLCRWQSCVLYVCKCRRWLAVITSLLFSQIERA